LKPATHSIFETLELPQLLKLPAPNTSAVLLSIGLGRGDAVQVRAVPILWYYPLRRLSSVDHDPARKCPGPYKLDIQGVLTVFD
jgi:hypothetical protein